jgi:alkylation response protein AidB-like acyl-CoA dehydrogenase
VNFDDTPEEAAFRAEVVAWLDAHAPKDAGSADENSMTISSHEAELAYNQRCKDWQRVKYDHGWAGITWPKQYGGRGGTAIEAGIFAEEEAKRVNATGLFSVGIGMAGPTIITCGTDAQKERFLDPMLRGEEIWCQLFSEPGAGSDLGNLSTRAERDGDEFVVNGQKVWNSGAHISDWGILLVRTDFDAPKHRGITYLLVDMRTPGIECRPIRQINGAAHFNETFLTDVRVPVENVVGEINGGWGPMMVTLSNERAHIGGAGGRFAFADLVELARRSGVADDPVWRQQLARTYSTMEIQRFLGYRVKTAASRGIEPGPESSIMKLLLSEFLGEMGDLVLGLQGASGMLSGVDAVDAGRWQMSFLTQWASRIGGGTDQVQRNTVGEKVLGLPPEPRPDKGVPFRDIPK